MRRDHSRGLRALGAATPALMTANAGHKCLFFPLGEGTGTTISDLGGTAVDLALEGTTTNAWATPALGIQCETQAANADMISVHLNSGITGLDMDYINAIYDCEGGFTDSIIYFGAEVTMAAAPAADANNYLFSMGQNDSVDPNAWGQLCVRINANLKPAWHLQTREATTANQYVVRSTAITAGTTPDSMFSMILPGTTSNVPWYRNGALNSTGSLAGLNDNKGPVASSTLGGIRLFGRTSNGAVTATALLGTDGAAGADTDPTVRNLIIGRCTYSAANVSRLQQLAAYLYYRKRLPPWFGDID